VPLAATLGRSVATARPKFLESSFTHRPHRVADAYDVTKTEMDMADHPLTTLGAEPPPVQPAEATPPLDLTLLLAVHHGLRHDLRRFADSVAVTPVTERERWQALFARWELFAALVHHCFQWERRHLFPLLAVAATRESRLQIKTMLETTRSRADIVEAMIESSRPVFERLTEARDEDAVATLRARVRAACQALEEALDGEEDDVIPLLRQHVASRAWQEGQHRLFDTEPAGASGQSIPWLMHALPLETAAVIAAGCWGGPSMQGLPGSIAAFRDAETKAFGRVPTALPGV
jgi:hypothetical protein